MLCNIKVEAQEMLKQFLMNKMNKTNKILQEYVYFFEKSSN